MEGKVRREGERDGGRRGQRRMNEAGIDDGGGDTAMRWRRQAVRFYLT
jgi:hypothetical protein